MSIRQYVGARYVPVICGDYDYNREYEPLSVVLYMGASYTSKKQTKAGILPTNEEYWSCTGNYNAQVEAYRQDVVSYKKQIFETCGYDLSNVVMIGDSYLGGVGGTSSADNWGTQLAYRLGLTNYRRYYNGGGGFVAKGGEGLTFADMVKIGSVFNGEATTHEAVTTVICMGGINDGVVYNDVYNGCVDFINACKNYFVNAKIVIVYTPTPRIYPNQQRNAVLNACLDCGVATPKNSYYWSIDGSDTFMYSDMIHLNSKGYARVGQILATWLLGEENIPVNERVINSYNGLTTKIYIEDGYAYIRTFGTIETDIEDNRLLINLPYSLTPFQQMTTICYCGSNNNELRNYWIVREGEGLKPSLGCSGTLVSGTYFNVCQIALPLSALGFYN